MANPYESAQTAIATAIESLVRVPNGYFILLDNQQDDHHPEDGLWMRATINWGERDITGPGCDARRRSFGILQFQIFSPVTEGTQAHACAVDNILTAMERSTITGVVYLTGNWRKIGRTQDGQLWQSNLDLPFYCDEV